MFTILGRWGGGEGKQKNKIKIENDLKRTHILELVDIYFKLAISNMIKELQKAMPKELKESITMVSCQMEKKNYTQKR